MAKISLIVFLFLFIVDASSILLDLDDANKEAIEIHIGTQEEYYKNHNYFKFEYNGINGSQIYFSFVKYDRDLYLTDPKGERKKLSKYIYYKNLYKDVLKYNGTYYLEIVCDSYFLEIGGTFNSTLIGDAMDTIDLNKNIYFNDFTISIYNWEYNNGIIEYKTSVLKKNVDMYFMSTDYDKMIYYPYYPGDPDKYSGPFYDLSNFEIIDVNNGNSEKNVKAFHFESGHEYIIKIHCFKRIGYASYYFFGYKFFPVTSQNFKTISGDEGILSSDVPIIGIINPKPNKNFYIMKDKINSIYFGNTEDTIKPDLSNLDNLKKIYDLVQNKKDSYKININQGYSTIFIAFSHDYESKVTINLVDEIDEDCKDSYKIPEKTTKLISCNENNKNLQYFNHIITFSTKNKNLRLIFSDEEQGTDYIIQNYFGPSIIAKRDSPFYNVEVTKYQPKFAIFGAADSYLYKTFYNYGKIYIKNKYGINIDNYMKVNQAYIRINSKYLPWFEFYNGYFNQIDLKLNFYIKQLYGGSELYECDAENNQKNFIFLTTPISGTKCKNKKSVFNRLFNFRDTKVISGYISPESYFDIYVEVEKENNDVIDIYSYTYEKLKIENNAKYLKKGVKYTLNFFVNHLIKLDPGFATEITITNGQTISRLTPEKPVTEILGSGFTIQSVNDSMVYFIGKISEQIITQREINYERSKGKVIKLSKVESDILIDIGFKGYLPSTVPYELRRRRSGIYYIDNVYEKLKGKLVEGEKLYVYHLADDNHEMKIEYIDKNLNYKNNDFNIFLIQPSYDNITSDLIIDTNQRATIIADLLFCKEDTILYMSLDGKDEQYAMFTNDNYTLLNKMKFDLFRGDNKVSFLSNQPVVFTYSYYDYIDENYFAKNEEYEEDRKKFYILTIENVTDNNNDDTIKIKFKPNYRNSSTRYIIIIARENSQNTFDNFNDPCYITNLINQRPKGVKIEVIYDVGENPSIETEVNIEDILHKTKKNYLINIISQELRFDKQTNFYQPLQFNHTRRKPDDGSGDDDETDKPTDKPTDRTDSPSPSPDSDGENNKEENKGGISDSTSLALAITLPIVSAIIIIAVVFIIFRHKSIPSEKIEELTKNNE